MPSIFSANLVDLTRYPLFCLYNSGSGYLSGDGLSGLESAARDTITKVLNNPDVQNLQEGLRSAGLKVRAYNSIRTHTYLTILYSYLTI
jgi:hypothetical protein